MTIQHHPDDDLLLAHAAGRLASGPALLMASHLEGCPQCRDRTAQLETIGGVLLEALPPESMAPEALARTLAAIDAPPATVPGHEGRSPHAPRRRPALPDGVAWPRALQHCSATPWRWLGPGMRWSRVTVPHDPAANVFLLRIGAGKQLPEHTHSECELTQVLCGTFHDGRALFGPGDFDEGDRSFHHQPTVQAGGDCICLASVTGRVLFKGVIARTLGALVGM
jgi:putative transcriptional regulator